MMTIKQHIDRAIRDFLSDPQRAKCLLCDTPIQEASLFFPQDSAAWGAYANKSRVILYGICKACKERPDHTKRVEARIFNQIARAALGAARN